MVLEYLAFFIGFRYYVHLRKKQTDHISTSNRVSIILGAIAGAFLGSRIIGFMENPILPSGTLWLQLLQVKTIMGGLFGGLLGVEIAKKIIKEPSSSGDLFTLPIIVGIFIGRIGCFLTGINEFTYGKVTTFFMGMDLGDGLMRHPIALYELIFLLGLFIVLRRIYQKQQTQTSRIEPGHLFQFFMITYFSFRFSIEFLKPNTFFMLGLSSIQWLCIVCVIYYHRTILKYLKYAN